MPNTRRIIRVFLASPGDLPDERQAVRETLAEWNESWAEALGYQFDLLAWEEVVAGVGRPQHKINQLLDRSDLLIGMIWKKWGTPPAEDGEFSSGFEEEFKRSMKRREKTGAPEVSMFFKEVSAEFLEDPGPDLTKVLDFRSSLIDGKQVLFQGFSSIQELERLTRKSLSTFANNMRRAEEAAEATEAEEKRSGENGGAPSSDRQRLGLPELAGVEFLGELVDRVGQEGGLGGLSATEVARFRLLANSVSKAGNQASAIGVHDNNLLFADCVGGLKLSQRELRSLVKFGFQSFRSENVPVWAWYSGVSSLKLDVAVLSSLAGTADEKAGAIRALTLLSRELPGQHDFADRASVVRSWFAKDSPASVRVAALGYLKKVGGEEDISTAMGESDRGDKETARMALECSIRLMIRFDRSDAAVLLALNSEFENLEHGLLTELLEQFPGLNDDELRRGTEHLSPRVRLRAVELLIDREVMTVDLAKGLCADASAEVRSAALGALEGLDGRLAEAEVKRILVRPKKSTWTTALIGSALRSDTEGERVLELRKAEAVQQLSEVELRDAVATASVYEDEHYLVLVEKFFGKHADLLRRDVDDCFKSYFEERVARVRQGANDNSASKILIRRIEEMGEAHRKQLTRRGLDILCRRANTCDLARVRSNLQRNYTGATIWDAKYLAKRGAWPDVAILARAKKDPVSIGLSEDVSEASLRKAIAEATLAIARGRAISDLLTVSMPDSLLESVVVACPESRFKRATNSVVLRLLRHDAEGVRRAVAQMVVRSFSKSRIKSMLADYLASGESRYYNVLHWLDVGYSLGRDDARSVVISARSEW